MDIRRCPPALLVRLKQDLRDYITELSADGLMTLQWSHIQFHEAASDRYLLQRDKVKHYHPTSYASVLSITQLYTVQLTIFCGPTAKGGVFLASLDNSAFGSMAFLGKLFK